MFDLEFGLLMISLKDNFISSLFLTSFEAKGYAEAFKPPALFIISVTLSVEAVKT